MIKAFLFCVTSMFCLSAAVMAQPRPVGSASGTAKPAPAPESFTAKYEGGMPGYNKEEGMLKFDDANDRLIFFGKDQKELFAISYDNLLVIYPQSKSVTSTAGNVISHIPLPGAGLAGFIKEKRSYLVIQFEDDDIAVKGLANFKLASKELLDSVLQTLAEKSKMIQRGDAYYRPKVIKNTESN